MEWKLNYIRLLVALIPLLKYSHQHTMCTCDHHPKVKASCLIAGRQWGQGLNPSPTSHLPTQHQNHSLWRKKKVCCGISMLGLSSQFPTSRSKPLENTSSLERWTGFQHNLLESFNDSTRLHHYPLPSLSLTNICSSDCVFWPVSLVFSDVPRSQLTWWVQCYYYC